jgi:outer membrane lipoprotein SlyB
MRKNLLGSAVLVTIGVLCAACAAKRPVLYPNEHYREVGQNAAQVEIDECIELSVAEGLETDRGKRVAGSTVAGAAAGAIVGTAVGAVLGNPGRGAGAGAAGGGAKGLLRGSARSRDLDPVQQRYVEECLIERGYKPIGWKRPKRRTDQTDSPGDP